jgi:Ser/Thr protein kinase RdoA (MazF antagonist)
MTISRTAEIRAVAVTDPSRAEAMLATFLSQTFGITATGLMINHDQYSLNSLNGFFSCEKGDCFFKFHQEEGEEDMRGEYYRADILARAGLPVDQPILSSTEPGEQILVYRRRNDPRFSDVLRALDLAPDADAAARALAAERELNEKLLAVAMDSLHPITPAQSRAEPIHRLFHERLIDPASGAWPAGRLASFYIGRDFALPGLTATWDEISAATPVINGIQYTRTLGQLFAASHQRLSPERLADAGGIVAHGDAHNANVWYERGAQADHLAFFDPAFAG